MSVMMLRMAYGIRNWRGNDVAGLISSYAIY